ncbi:hypothetical protein [Flavobacterium defluvii]|uniref:Outer membrane protein beta-barrel domain-containing protein n=1 Tax=Flavobacterium defluvii TaxID=370979 RepID=A0A1M5HH76_9FLAO|nr:hypothetical protein [Flavobacterium defluvii]SHG15324.1 hypothetical protein SAMN05443663_10237 [Flavobacterium defluvii]
MKQSIFIFLFCLIIQINYSQNSGVEKSIFNIQTGFLGVWVNNELRLSNQISLRSEIGLDAGLRGCSDCDTKYALAPVITLEPRWYYNINKRILQNKGSNNSANFLTLAIKYHPDLFVISNTDNTYVSNQIAFIPKWGIRRNIGNSNFNYEAGIGIGYKYYIDEKQFETAADLHLRIGYTFK